MKMNTVITSELNKQISKINLTEDKFFLDFQLYKEYCNEELFDGIYGTYNFCCVIDSCLDCIYDVTKNKNIMRNSSEQETTEILYKYFLSTKRTIPESTIAKIIRLLKKKRSRESLKREISFRVKDWKNCDWKDKRTIRYFPTILCPAKRVIGN